MSDNTCKEIPSCRTSSCSAPELSKCNELLFYIFISGDDTNKCVRCTDSSSCISMIGDIKACNPDKGC